MKHYPERVSVHGGHSGQFCDHAADTLEEVVKAYIVGGFSWVGITEHMPPADSAFLYPEERKAGMTPELLHRRFAQYIRECRRLQQKFQHRITLFVGMEIETCRGYRKTVEKLLGEFHPDYIVGSVHHVEDIPFDYSQDEYDRAAQKAGGLDALYCRYFDLQYEMLTHFKPAVVGHFDLIRIFDPDYKRRLAQPEIMSRIERNLEVIQHAGLILDYNLRALLKGADEPYAGGSILALAHNRHISVVPGDDSHGVSSIGINIDRAIAELDRLGFDTKWPRPALY
jgi:histidinol-phosphatase (PHP family)